jgi:hypothetical protein
MPSVTQGIQSGYQIGRAFADPAPTEPSKMQSYVMKELIEGAYGVFRRKDGSVYVPQHFPKEARQLVIHKYIEKEKQASKEMFEEKKAKIEMVGKLQGVMEKVSEWGTDPKTKNFAIATYTQMIGEILGDKAQEMGVEKIADVATAAVTSQERKEAVDQKLYEILSGLFLKYNETNDIDYLNKYASLFAADPKKFAEWGLSNPQTKIEDHFEKLEKDNNKKTTKVVVAGKDDPYQQAPGTVYELGEGPEGKTFNIKSSPSKTAKDAKPFLLPNGQSVLSFDGGKTYEDTNGQEQSMPTGAIPISASVTGEDVRLIRRQQKIKDDTETPPETPTAKEMRLAAESATGPWANLKAAIDAVAGGLGVAGAFGENGLFRKTQDNRQMLRLIKQTSKSALLNSSRGAVWEQQITDTLFPDPSKIWVNPSTEARKFDTLRKIFITEIYLNNRAILSATNPKAADKLAQSNLEMERLLDLIGREDTTTPKKEDLEEKYGIKLTQ